MTATALQKIFAFFEIGLYQILATSGDTVTNHTRNIPIVIPNIINTP